MKRKVIIQGVDLPESDQAVVDLVSKATNMNEQWTIWLAKAIVAHCDVNKIDVKDLDPVDVHYFLEGFRAAHALHVVLTENKN